MNTRVDALLEEARKLTPDEREELLLRLQWPDEGTPAEVEVAWVAEAERRAAQRDIQWLTHEQLQAELQKSKKRP